MIVIYIGAYLVFGLVALVLLDCLTGRVRSRLVPASYETQKKLVASGSLVGSKMAVILTAGALWIFWPVAIYGAISTAKKGDKNG